MNLSERSSRVIRGDAEWQPLRMSVLAGPRGRQDPAGAAQRRHGIDVEARIAAAFQDGLAEGRYRADAETQERERQLGLSAQQRWSDLLGSLAIGVSQIENSMADRLLDLASLLAAKIACREVVLAKDRIEPVLAEALKMITGSCRQMEVTAHPADCEAIEAWLKPQCDDSTLMVRADPSFAPGGCVLRADDATLDATLQTRIERTLAALGIDARQARTIADAAVADLLATPVADLTATPAPGEDLPR